MLLIYIIGVIVVFSLAVYYLTKALHKDDIHDLDGFIIIIALIFTAFSWIGAAGIIAIRLGIHMSEKEQLKEKESKND